MKVWIQGGESVTLTQAHWVGAGDAIGSAIARKFAQRGLTVCAARRNGDKLQPLVDELTGGSGFDDIVMLDPRSAATVGDVARHIARRGTLNLVGTAALDGLVDTDVGRLHYDYIAFLGGRGPDIAAAYGEARNRCDLHPKGTAVFVGAGGPMGQMHVQRAIELPDGPRRIIATEVSDERLKTLQDRLSFSHLPSIIPAR